MPLFFDRRTLLRHTLAAVAAGTTAVLWPMRQAQACEFFCTTLRVLHPWTRESASTDTTALVCMTLDEVSTDERLIGVETPVAQGAYLLLPGGERAAVFDLPLPAGQVTRLHEMASCIELTGLRQPLQLGREYPLTLIFAVAGRVNTMLTVDYAR